MKNIKYVTVFLSALCLLSTISILYAQQTPLEVIEPSADAEDLSAMPMRAPNRLRGSLSEGLYVSAYGQAFLAGRVRSVHRGGHITGDDAIWYLEIGFGGKSAFYALGSDISALGVPVGMLYPNDGAAERWYFMPQSSFLDFFRHHINVPVVAVFSLDNPWIQTISYDACIENPFLNCHQYIDELTFLYQNSHMPQLFALARGLGHITTTPSQSVPDKQILVGGQLVLPVPPPEDVIMYRPLVETAPTEVLLPDNNGHNWLEQNVIVEADSARFRTAGLYRISEAELWLSGRVRGLHRGGGHMRDDDSIWYMEVEMGSAVIVYIMLGQERPGDFLMVGVTDVDSEGNSVISTDRAVEQVGLTEVMDFFRQNANLPIAVEFNSADVPEAGADLAVETDLQDLYGAAMTMRDGSRMRSFSRFDRAVLPAGILYLPLARQAQ